MHAGRQNTLVHAERRQLLAAGARLVEHEVNILQGLAHAPLGRKIARDHLRALGAHHLRRGGGRLRDRQECRGIKAEPLGEDEPFGERQPVEAEDEIDGELGAPAVADAADMEAGGEQRIEDGSDFRRECRLAADQRDAVAAPHLLAGAGHRHFQEPQARRLRLRTQDRHPIRVAGAGAQQDRIGTGVPLRQDVLVDDLLDLIGREDGNQDGVARRARPRRSTRPRARRGFRARRPFGDRRRSRERQSRRQTAAARKPDPSGRSR